jgi:fumarate reductase subunit D
VKIRGIAALDRIIWPIFGAGFFAVAFFYPAIALLWGLLEPLGWVSADFASFERAAAFARGLPGRILLFAVIALPLWNGAFHLRHTGMDLLGTESDRWIAPPLYMVALLGTILAAAGLWRL